MGIIGTFIGLGQVFLACCQMRVPRAAKPNIGARVLRFGPDRGQAFARTALRHIHPNARIALEIGDNRLAPFILDRAIEI